MLLFIRCIYTFDKELLIFSNYRCVNLYYCRYVLQLRDPQMFNQGLDLMMVLSTPFNRMPADSFLLKSSCIVWSYMTWFNDFTPAWHCTHHQIITLPHIKHSFSPSLKCSFWLKDLRLQISLCIALFQFASVQYLCFPAYLFFLTVIGQSQISWRDFMSAI